MWSGNSPAKASLGERLAAAKGRPSGFDYMRLGLAVSIVIVHSRSTTYGAGVPIIAEAPHGGAAGGGAALSLFYVLHGLVVAYHRAIVPMFFALSGFLVAGSLERSKTLLTFVGLRAIRIYPALAVEVVLSAMLIGPAVTTLPLSHYFQDPLFFSYLLNALGDIHFFLPGVFETNPIPRIVNLQLWTVPYELLCYVVLAGLVVLGATRRKILIPLAALALWIVEIVMHWSSGEWFKPTETFGGVQNGRLLVVCFLAGVSLYMYRERVAWSPRVFIGSAVASIICFWLVPSGDYPAMLPIAYVTVYLGLTNFSRIRLIEGADYSYGIYLYGFVVQQLFVYLTAPRFWWVNALATVPLTAAFAAFSWHLIEKPAQDMRKPLGRLEQHYLLLKQRLFLGRQAGGAGEKSGG